MNTSQRDRYTLKYYTRLIISFFICLLLLSVFQYATLYYKGIVETIFSYSFFIAIAHQLGFASIIGIVLVFPFNFWENLRTGYGLNLTFATLVVLLIIEAMLITYFCTALVPLGSDILGYSYTDIKETVSNSGGISWLPIVGVVLITAIFYCLYKLTSKYYHHLAKMYPFTIILFSLFICTLFLEGKPINENKTQYLAVNLYNSSTEDTSYNDDEEYPLISSRHIENALGDYFELQEQKPDIVFLIVEGLGRDFVGEGAEFGGFTPFLDELSQNSLYWENCLSTTGRTFGVLPGLLGSLPFGKSGFMELEKYPNKITLFSILKNNDYHTSFYQGTNGSFDNVDKFLISEDVDFILDKGGFGSEYELQEENEGFSWGYPDKELFNKSLSLQIKGNKPRLEVFMTISNHEPFIPPNPDHYKKKAAKMFSIIGHDPKTKKVIKKNKNIFETLLYTDDALKYFFDEYKKNPRYNNTIFVVTGDHRLIPIPQRNSISRFHVPLMIYSPLLKKAEKISSVSSHFDVTPSLLALLENKYEMKMPKKTAWMGQGLDMHKTFRSTKDIPLMRNKNELKEYISAEKVLSNGKVYELNEDMNLETSFSGSTIKDKLKAFKSMNAYVTTNNKIIPDSLAIFTLKKEKFTDSEMVWINSLYNGYNSDKYFLIARNLAFDKEYDKTLLLCRYILSETPRHIDTKILTGRVNAWRGEREKSIAILRECVNQNPDYIDSYAALFDVFFWEGRHKDALELIETVKQNSSSASIIEDKIARAKKEANKAGITNSTKPILKQEATATLVIEE